MEDRWEHFFKPEVRRSGAKLFSQEKVWLANTSDIAIQASLKASPPCRVHFTSSDIASEAFVAECNCAQGKKGQFCKHIWATLLQVAQKYPDFLSSKIVMQRQQEVSAPEPASDRQKQRHTDFQAAAAERAAIYRKAQYQKHKLERKESKRALLGRNPSTSERVYPPEVAAALAYFEQNGFSMPDGLDGAIINEAKRKLSRVFHPDKGGSNEEIIQLNHFYEVILEYLQPSPS